MYDSCHIGIQHDYYLNYQIKINLSKALDTLLNHAVNMAIATVS